MRFGRRILKVLRQLKRFGEGKPDLPDGFCESEGPAQFANTNFVDWPEAELESVCLYLRGGKKLRAPPQWRHVFPTFAFEEG